MPWPDADGGAIDKVTITRWLCISIYGVWAATLLMLLFMAVAPSVSDMESAEVLSVILPFGVAAYLWWFVGRWALVAWRRCDRCREPLFGEIRDKRFPHYQAKQLLGSYFNATAWQYIRHGSARCIWCGHRDGNEPDYVARR